MTEPLIDRLKSYSAYDPARNERAIDGEIWCVMNGLEFERWDGAGCCYIDKTKRVPQRGHHQADRISKYTRSIDACFGLIRNALRGQRVYLEQIRDDRWFAGFKDSERESIGGENSAYASTAEFALLAALLKVRERELS